MLMLNELKKVLGLFGSDDSSVVRVLFWVFIVAIDVNFSFDDEICED